MTDRQDDILRKVRALIAKASSTDFPEEAEAFRRKADALMEAYAIETWMLETGKDETKARLIKTVAMDMQWWADLKDLEFDARSNVWYLFTACVKHCRCVADWSTRDYRANTVRVYGMSSDIAYLDLLFTDLFIQLFDKIKPKYDPNRSLGENVMRAKEAGMKYIDIAVWAGHPEWREMTHTGGYKTCDGGKMLREYKKHLEGLGKSPRDVVTVHPDNYRLSYTYSFYAEISKRLRAMRDDRAGGQTGSTALALRDIEDLAREAMYEDFPELRPHPEDCDCDSCHRCDDPECTRTGCVARRKPVKYRGPQGRRMVGAGLVAGKDAGEKARIVTQSEGLRSTQELSK